MHRAWIVAAVGFIALLASAAIRATFGVLMDPLIDEFGWSHGEIATAASVNLVVFGISAPFAAALTERFGMKRTVSVALAVIALCAAGITQVHELFELYFIWGLVAGAATGAVAPVLAAAIAGRWFTQKRGLVVGMLTAANSTGQLIFLPLMAHITETTDWRWVALVVGGAAVLALGAVLLALKDDPSDVGLEPYGGADPDAMPSRRLPALAVLKEVRGDKIFLALAGSFFICGATTVGLIAVHLIPAAHDHGISAGTAAGLMAAMGVLDIAGTTGSGYLTDRYDPRKLLWIYYTGRGLSLLILPAALSAEGGVLTAFTIFYGLDWIATVPPTVALVTRRFGREVGLVAYGWIFGAHQIGAAAAAFAAGLVRDEAGTYTGVFYVCGALCFLAAIMLAGARVRPSRAPAVAAAG